MSRLDFLAEQARKSAADYDELRAAVENLIGDLKHAGFGTDDEIYGPDVIDLINEHFHWLEALTKKE